MRLFEKDKQKNFFVPEHISKQIVEDDFLQLLINHSMEAAYTLNFLYEIGKITQLSLSCNFEREYFEVYFIFVLHLVRRTVVHEIAKLKFDRFANSVRTIEK